MATKKQIEDAIFEREGFRVELDLLEGKKGALPAYDYRTMAPQRWKVSEWKNERLAAYRMLVKSATVLRGDGTRERRTARQFAGFVLRSRIRAYSSRLTAIASVSSGRRNGCGSTRS